MQIRYTSLPGPPRNPLIRLLVGLVGAVFFIGAAFLGALVFLAVLGLFVVGTLLLSMRLWWLRRRLRTGNDAKPRGQVPARGRGTVIDGDYTVVAPRHSDSR